MTPEQSPLRTVDSELTLPERTSAGNYRYIPLSLFLYRSIVVQLNGDGILSLTVDILYVNLFMVGPSHILSSFLNVNWVHFSMKYSNLQKEKS